MRTLVLPRLALPAVCVFLAGCAAARPIARGCLPPADGDIVFVADGAGDYRTTSAAFSEAVRQTGAPLRIETFAWSHGYRRMLIDHVDHCNHLEQGRRLAALVAAARQSCPPRAVYLVGHSTGCAVVLAAAEASPPDAIERILLLAPAISTDYDLRPALSAAKHGIDAFTSCRDVGALRIGTGIVGTADSRRALAAGRVGFTPIIRCPGDKALYAKLREHPWDPVVAWSGNRGNHYGTIQPGYVRAYLLPLLVRPTALKAE